MTVMVAEQAGKQAARKAGQKTVQGKVSQSSYQTYNTRTRQRPAPSRASAATPDGSARAAADAASSRAGRPSGPSGRGLAIPGDRGYQPVILAEFLAAAVIITLTPIATGGSPAAQAKNSPSPYDTGDLRQLVAVGGVYFVLALLSSGNSGRLAAWFGGLVLIALGMSKMAHGQLTAVFHAVTPQTGVEKSGPTAEGAV